MFEFIRGINEQQSEDLPQRTNEIRVICDRLECNILQCVSDSMGGCESCYLEAFALTSEEISGVKTALASITDFYCTGAEINQHGCAINEMLVVVITPLEKSDISFTNQPGNRPFKKSLYGFTIGIKRTISRNIRETSDIYAIDISRITAIPFAIRDAVNKITLRANQAESN